MIAHINSDTTEQIGEWVLTVLSSAFDPAAKGVILTQIAATVRGSGGWTLSMPAQGPPPGMLVVTIKGRRTGKLAALVLVSRSGTARNAGHGRYGPDQ